LNGASSTFKQYICFHDLIKERNDCDNNPIVNNTSRQYSTLNSILPGRVGDISKKRFDSDPFVVAYGHTIETPTINA
jgi:hypothetical protein